MIFKLTYRGHEDVYCHLFESFNKTKEDWEADCRRALKEIGCEYINFESSWVTASRWIEAATKKLVEYGYDEVEPVSWTFCGGDIIGNNSNEWAKIVGEELYAKAIKKNKEVKERLDEIVFGKK